MSAKNLQEAESASEYYSARELLDACASELATDSNSTAQIPFNLCPVAIAEAKDALEKAGKKLMAVKHAEAAELRNQKRAIKISTLNAPVGSMVRHTYNISINYNPDGVNDGLDTFDVVGDVCDANYGGDILTTSLAEAKIPRKAKLDVLAFDRLIENIAARLPELVLTAIAEVEKEKCLQALEKFQLLESSNNERVLDNVVEDDGDHSDEE